MYMCVRFCVCVCVFGMCVCVYTWCVYVCVTMYVCMYVYDDVCEEMSVCDCLCGVISVMVWYV